MQVGLHTQAAGCIAVMQVAAGTLPTPKVTALWRTCDDAGPNQVGLLQEQGYRRKEEPHHAHNLRVCVRGVLCVLVARA